MDKRVDRFGLPLPPRKPETRKPLLWLARDGNELFLVNSSGEIIDLIISNTGGFTTADDDDCLTVPRGNGYEYNNVLPGDAVKVDEYDGFYDLDYVLQITIMLQSTKLGSIEIIPPAEKGGVGETVLLWDTMESGKNVTIKNWKNHKLCDP